MTEMIMPTRSPTLWKVSEMMTLLPDRVQPGTVKLSDGQREKRQNGKREKMERERKRERGTIQY